MKKIDGRCAQIKEIKEGPRKLGGVKPPPKKPKPNVKIVGQMPAQSSNETSAPKKEATKSQ